MLDTSLCDTNNLNTNQVIQELIVRFESDFPTRVVSYYVEGSHADHTAVATSDLDLTIVFRDEFVSEQEREAAQQLVTTCAQASPIELDITLIAQTTLRQQADPMFKLGARLLYGEEIRATIPLMPIASWARQRMHAAYWLLINVFQRPKPVYAPLTFPQPGAPFWGYTARKMQLADGSQIPTTRNLIRVTGWIATARIAYQTQHYVVRKRDCVPTYREAINDEWTVLLEQIDRRCRTDWQYRIPATLAEQEELRLILQNTLAFENHFLACYREFLLAELTRADCIAQRDALRVLGNTFFHDREISAAIKRLQTVDEPSIQAAAERLVQDFIA